MAPGSGVSPGIPVDVHDRQGAVVRSEQLPDGIFGVTPNVAVMHQVVTAQLAAARSGTHSTRTRAEVSGGGSKPWRQKGTGRARQGSTRAPHWRGGGVAHGPHPRSYKQRTPKKMVWLALRSALSDRAADGKIAVIDAFAFPAPKTRYAVATLAALGMEPGERVLVVLERDDDNAWRSFRNLGDRVWLCESGQLNTYDVLVCDRVVFTAATLAHLCARAPAPEAGNGAPGAAGGPDGAGETTGGDS